MMANAVHGVYARVHAYVHKCMHVHIHAMDHCVGSGGRAVERRTVNREDGGSIPPTAVSKLRQFRNPTFVCVFQKRH